ncbi:glycoside hydrolase family 3 C-terminal domain-containing protein [Paenarthrobacter sp. AR 02]|uniref:glycoside hydrolase family 3 N-terminal domain-containing protein n=1 Tax=Paenarthrobacter sp. AR 02 TaxID=2899821 RepID=UPI001F2D6BB5|nr:glycoside hydrolase family 3 N-terminal domain-containing protein [Paenarthrobacter sp. AR 02]MCF3140723.1 glycoside hydrolase family 3 C-terminal domain-containing protein [Paenarthrobacter sp. AR 02]
MTSAPVQDQLVENLLEAMTWEEKLGQLQIAFRPRLEDAADLVRGGIGAIFWPRSAAATNELQRIAREETAHGIPLLVGLDVIHGQRTTFPVPLAQAASFDPAVSETDARVTAQEAASGGVNWTFSPMIDVSRDPRWGRVVEGFGEDTYVNSVFGAAKVRGYQGDSLGDPDSILACAKHFVAYGQAEGGRDYNTVDVSGQRLRNVYLDPFRAAVDAGVATVMAAFNTVSGRPAHANHHLLTSILKDEFGFEGVVVGDADGVVNLLDHGIAEDLDDALRQSFAAGLDIEMGGSVTTSDDGTRLGPGHVPLARVDDAVRRVLRLKLALGLFADPYKSPGDEVVVPSSESRRAALATAEKGLVLLKNHSVLPLGTARQRVLLVGPYANSTDHLGAWVQSFAEPAGSLAEAIREECPEWDVTVREGTGFFGGDPDLIGQAVADAADFDAIVVAVGEPSALTGEASSRSDLRLPGAQEQLIRAVAATGRPSAVVMFNGRPLVTSDWIDAVPALLEAWHSGLEGPRAVARALNGAVNPGGRLPMTFPRSSSQVPIYYDHENTGRPAKISGRIDAATVDVGLMGPGNTDDFYTSKYRDLDLGPQFPFGHGLSYTTFEYGTPSVTPASISLDDLRAGGSVQVAVSLTNAGAVAGDEVTMVFIRDLVASLAQPVRRLRSFARSTLDPSQATMLTFELGWKDLGFWDNQDQYAVEAGTFEIHVGGGLEHAQVAELRVT